MIEYKVRTYRSEEYLARDDQLAWKIAEVAADPVAIRGDVREMVINRLIDNAAGAAASILREPVAAARDQALRHPYRPGATVFGCQPSLRVSPEWAAWANAVAVRELDFHDTFLAAEYAHPGDNIAPLLAVAQHAASRGVTGQRLVASIATAYEIQIDLSRSMSLHAHKIDHVAHLGASVAAGLGTLLGLDVATIFHAVGQALHTTTATRQSRKGEISTWKAYAPAFAGKVAIEAVDRAMRGQTSPAPIYEGEDGLIAQLLDGPGATYSVSLPGPSEEKRAILDSFTKEHSAEYQAQAWIDLARRLHRDRPELARGEDVESITLHTSHHTHYVIGSGSRDPQKYDPAASRETLDHSVAYIFAVALQDGSWHHEASYAPERARREDTVALWNRIRTVEDPQWTAWYLADDPRDRRYGGRVEIQMKDGTIIVDQIDRPDAHTYGARPFTREQYVEKFWRLSEGVVERNEAERFLSAAERLGQLEAQGLAQLTFRVSAETLARVKTTEGLF